MRYGVGKDGSVVCSGRENFRSKKRGVEFSGTAQSLFGQDLSTRPLPRLGPF